MQKKLDEELRGTYLFTVAFGIILIIGMIIRMFYDHDTYTLSIFISLLLKIIPIILTCMILDDLYRIKTKKYRKDKLCIEAFLLVLCSLGSISYDFNLTSTILFIILLGYNFLVITTVFTRKR